MIDGDILLELGISDYNYQSIDKFADFVSYFFMLLLGMRWSIKKIVIVLFAFRAIGQILFFATRDELMFFYFPNFLEPLMMAYSLILFKRGSDKKAFVTYKKHLFLIWFIIIAYKLFDEWHLHFANIDLSLFFFGFTGG